MVCHETRQAIRDYSAGNRALAGQFADERELTPISEALDELAKADTSLAELVDLKFFCGFSCAEIAAMHGVSERMVQRKWEKARIYIDRSVRAPVPL